MLPYGQLIKVYLVTCCACGYSDIYAGDNDGTTPNQIKALAEYKKRGWTRGIVSTAWLCPRCHTDITTANPADVDIIRWRIKSNLAGWKPAKNRNMVRHKLPIDK